MADRRHERPIPRTNPSGEKVWVARWTARDGRRYSAGTYQLKRQAQAAIDAAYDAEQAGGPGPREQRTVGEYAETWTQLHPRGERTDVTYNRRLKAILDVRVGGRAFGRWPMRNVERAELATIVDVMLRDQGRAATGARAIIGVLSAMFEDAIVDRVAVNNPARGLRIRGADPRITKQSRAPLVWTWEQMETFAAGAGTPHGTAMILSLGLCGLRLGEMLPLERGDIEGAWLTVRRTAYEGVVEDGTKTTRGQVDPPRRVPLPAELAAVFKALPPRLDTRLLFSTRYGKARRHESFYRTVWARARAATPAMAMAVPHDFRHSFVSLLRAEGVDPAVLAEWTGHTVQTATTRYVHSVNADAAAAEIIAKRRLTGRIQVASHV